jgi:hypothetical protein
MKTCFILLLFGLSAHLAMAQSTHDVMVGGGLDVVKTDNYKLFEKAQLGLEINYFVVRHFAVGGGIEVWTRQQNSFVIGMRWYADEHFFARFRGLIGANDASLGIGWSQPIHQNLRFEVLGDYYFHSDFALRAGIQYIIR